MCLKPKVVRTKSIWGIIIPKTNFDLTTFSFIGVEFCYCQRGAEIEDICALPIYW